MSNQDTDLNPNVDQWNNGTEPAAELTRLLALRRAAMEGFGERAIQVGRPMAQIEEALVPLYLHHRYAVDSAVTVLGGQEYIYAIRGDGRTPTKWVPAARQRAALDAIDERATAERPRAALGGGHHHPAASTGLRDDARDVPAHDRRRVRSGVAGDGRH